MAAGQSLRHLHPDQRALAMAKAALAAAGVAPAPCPAAAWQPAECADAALAAAAVALAASAAASSPAEVQAALEEQEAKIELALHDAHLERLRLTSLLQRYRERPPSVEDLVKRREEELEEAFREVERLRDETAFLAFGPEHEADVATGDAVGRSASAGSLDEGAAAARRRAAGGAAGRRARPRTAAEELYEEARRLRGERFAYERGQRWAALEERRLEGCRAEAQATNRELRQQERRADEARRRRKAAEAHLAELQRAAALRRVQVDREQNCVRQLNREVYDMREACYVPSRMKRESEFLMKFLDQGGGGRLSTRRHRRGLDACARLYDAVAAEAPALLALAGRARSAMEAEFAKYLQLEEAHNLALRSVHVAVTRNVCGQGEPAAARQRRHSAAPGTGAGAACGARGRRPSAPSA